MNHNLTPLRLSGLLIVLMSTFTINGLAAELIDQTKAEAIAAIANTREGTITDLVNQWRPTATALGYPAIAWAAEFSTLLHSASDAQLYDVQNAASYDAVRAILQGRSAPVSLESVAGIEALGDTTSDLTYTPVTPCRVLDTRFDNDGSARPAAGLTKHFYVHGSNTELAPQGHTAGTGCAAPKGEPAGIAANFAVVPYSTGHIRVWPFASSMPTASFLNYQSGNNLANAGIIATCYACSYDMSIYNSTDTHYLADVMGYFYPVNRSEFTPAFAGVASNWETYLNTTCTNRQSVTIHAKGPGFITVTAQVHVALDNDAIPGNSFKTYIGTSSTNCPDYDPVGGYQSSSTGVNGSLPVGIYHFHIPLSRTFSVNAAGDYTYYLNASTNTVNSTKIDGSGMQATFHHQ